MLTARRFGGRNFYREHRAATAVEFALVLPAYLLCIIGGLYACLALFTATSLQYAVEQGSRCAAVNSSSCTDSASTISYAQSHYLGLAGSSPTFTYADASCGHSLTGAVSYGFNLGMSSVTVPITATACFP
jgi:Flp pilus assembly protein TadG